MPNTTNHSVSVHPLHLTHLVLANGKIIFPIVLGRSKAYSQVGLKSKTMVATCPAKWYLISNIAAMDELATTKPISREPVPAHSRSALLLVAKRVFWWGEPEEWLDDIIRFTAQVMTYGDWDDTILTLKLLGESTFKQVLINPSPGVFGIKSWNFWHIRFSMPVPPLPVRKL